MIFQLGRNRSCRHYWPVAVALAIGLGTTAGLTSLLWRSAQQFDQARFDMFAHLVQALFDDKVEKYEQVIGRISEFFHHEVLPTQTAWEQLMDRVKVHSHYPSLLEVGYVREVTGAEVIQPSPTLREAMGTNCVLPGNLAPEQGYRLLLYSKVQPPLNWYHTGVPVDELPINGTIANSSYRNSFSVTPLTPLGFGGAPTSIFGFYMVRAVYSDNLPVDTPMGPGESSSNFFRRLVYQRAPHFRGCVVGAIDVDRLLKEALKGTVLEIAFEIFDAPTPSAGERLNSHFGVPAPEDRLRRLDLTNRVSLWEKYTQRWAIVSCPTAAFERRSPRRMAWIVLGAGIATTLCFTGLVWSQTQRRLAAEANARQMNEAREVIDSLSREREQLSRDLHDGVLQSLYALGLGLQQTRKTIGHDPVLAEERCRQNLDALELAMGEVRRHLDQRGSCPAVELDLAVALRNLAEIMNRQGGVLVDVDLDSPLRRQPRPEIALQLMQIAREAVSNAQRHSGAEHIRVSLKETRAGLDMTIADDGRGFDAGKPPACGYGLRNMADRARDMEAHYEFASSPGKGVRLKVHLPAASLVGDTLNAEG